MANDSGKKIFIIDDDKFLLDMYSLKFNKAGYDVKTADSTEEALKTIRDGYEPEIVLCDIHQIKQLPARTAHKSEAYHPASFVR